MLNIRRSGAHDRYTIGFITGAIAGFLADLTNFLLTKVFRIGKVGYEDFASVLVFGEIPSTIGQSIFAHFVQLFFSALVGAVFAYWIKKVSERNLMFKGISFGLFIWFFAFSVSQLFKLQYLQKLDLETVIVNNIAAIIYGIMLGISLRWLKPEGK